MGIGYSEPICSEVRSPSEFFEARSPQLGTAIRIYGEFPTFFSPSHREMLTVILSTTPGFGVCAPLGVICCACTGSALTSPTDTATHAVAMNRLMVIRVSWPPQRPQCEQ